jgi:hypothetical protein
MTLEIERREFIARSKRYLAFPAAGACVWVLIGLTSLFVGKQTALWVLLFGSGAIFPLALVMARITGQEVFIKNNRFGRLVGQCVLMVNLLWAVNIPMVAVAPQLVPLSVAIGLGLHWIVVGWINGAGFGLVHAVLRTALCVTAYGLFPQQRVFAIAMAVVATYAFTLWQLSRDASFDFSAAPARPIP